MINQRLGSLKGPNSCHYKSQEEQNSLHCAWFLSSPLSSLLILSLPVPFYNTTVAMHKCAVFLLAVISCSHLVFSVEGRQIKSVSKIDSKQSNQVDYSAKHKKDHQPAAPSYIPNAAHHSASASGKKEVLPPPIPTKSSDFGDSVAGYKDAFRPTTPGNSPGAGHSVAVGDEDIEQKSGSISSSNDKHSIAGAKEGVRPTNLGHSPGVGHVFLSKKSEPNA